jgi:hypothetical protein
MYVSLIAGMTGMQLLLVEMGFVNIFAWVGLEL